MFPITWCTRVLFFRTNCSFKLTDFLFFAIISALDLFEISICLGKFKSFLNVKPLSFLPLYIMPVEINSLLFSESFA